MARAEAPDDALDTFDMEREWWQAPGEYVVDGTVFREGPVAHAHGALQPGSSVQVALADGGAAEEWRDGELEAVVDVQVPNTDVVLVRANVVLEGARGSTAFALDAVRQRIGPLQSVIAERQAEAAQQQQPAAPSVPAGPRGIDALFADSWQTVTVQAVDAEAEAAAAASTAAHLSSLDAYAAGDETALEGAAQVHGSEGGQAPAPGPAAADASAAIGEHGAEDSLAAFAPHSTSGTVVYKGVVLEAGTSAGPQVPVSEPAAVPAVFKARSGGGSGRRRGKKRRTALED